MTYLAVGEELAVFASNAGADTIPDSLHNLKAHPEARVEIGTETFDVTAQVLDAEEREPVREVQKAR